MTDILLAALAGAALAGCVFLVFRQRGPGTVREAPPIPKADGATFVNGSGSTEILERMSEGVLVVDGSLRPSFANPAARQLLGFQPGDLPARLPSVEVIEVVRAALDSGEPAEELVEIFFPKRISLKVHAAQLVHGEGALIVLQDVSDELRVQKMRREFVTHASHELKSPVASLQVLGEALQNALSGGDNETAERFSGKILDELDRLSKLVGDLLDLSRLEDVANRSHERCDVASVARRVVEQLEGTAQLSGLTLSSDIDEQLWVVGDAQQLSLLVRNLVQNAIQYTAEGGNVRVDVRDSGDGAMVRVSDDGMGIPLDSQSRIFERFYRVDRARSRDRGGTGLGLAIVKHVAEQHGGTIEVQSELGNGSIFTVRLPLGSAGRTSEVQASSEPATETRPSDRESA